MLLWANDLIGDSLSAPARNVMHVNVSRPMAGTRSTHAPVGSSNPEHSAVDKQDANAGTNCRRHNAAQLARVQIDVADSYVACVAGVGVGHRGGHCVGGLGRGIFGLAKHGHAHHHEVE